MWKGIRILTAGWLLVSLNACLQVDSRVTVFPDGSGTIEETVTMSGEMVAMMEQMAQGMSEEGEGSEGGEEAGVSHGRKGRGDAPCMVRPLVRVA